MHNFTFLAALAVVLLEAPSALAFRPYHHTSLHNKISMPIATATFHPGMPKSSGVALPTGTGFPAPYPAGNGSYGCGASSGFLTGTRIGPKATGCPSPPTTSSAPNATVPSNSTNEFLRGVNIGNWLVLEKWMDADGMFSGAFSGADDQYTFDSISGAEQKLQTHWSTWFTVDDVAKIAATGMNALRIPIGE